MPPFLSNTRGNFSIIFALSAVPMIGAVALAVDYAAVINTKSAVQNAADAAILAGVRQAERAVVSGQSADAAERLGEQLATQYFRAHMDDHNLAFNGQFSPNIEVTPGNYAGTAVYDGVSASVFGKIFEISEISFDIEAAANIAGQQYNEIHIVIDNSASMGVGADTASISAMDGAFGCAFACHVPPGIPGGFTSTHIDARNAGARLRIDVVKDASADLVSTLQAQGLGDLLNIAVHTFSNSLETVLAPTDDLSRVQTALASIDLTSDMFEGGTNLDETFRRLETAVGVSGDGASPANRRKSVILITDGVATNIRFDTTGLVVGTADPAFRAFAPVINGAPGSYFTSQGFDDRLCRDIKERNDVTMMTLNVEYVIPTVGTDGDIRFAEIESTLKPDIQRHMEACASSPTLAERANNPTEIKVALNALLENLEAYNLRLTN